MLTRIKIKRIIKYYIKQVFIVGINRQYFLTCLKFVVCAIVLSFFLVFLYFDTKLEFSFNVSFAIYKCLICNFWKIFAIKQSNHNVLLAFVLCILKCMDAWMALQQQKAFVCIFHHHYFRYGHIAGCWQKKKRNASINFVVSQSSLCDSYNLLLTRSIVWQHSARVCHSSHFRFFFLNGIEFYNFIALRSSWASHFNYLQFSTQKNRKTKDLQSSCCCCCKSSKAEEQQNF